MHTVPTRRDAGLARRSRAGISLLEVLVSMFVLLLGLVGIASLFPVGHFYVSRAARYDRAAAVGHKAFNELEARGLLQPDLWLRRDGTPLNPTDRLMPLAIDPLGCAAQSPSGNPAGLDWFPFGSDSASGIRRVTYAGPGGIMNRELAEAIFMTRDDLQVDFDPSVDAVAGGGIARGDKLSVQLNDGNRRTVKGEYTWMFTAATAPGLGDDVYMVSVVVFHRRDPFAEWLAVGTPALPSGGGGRLRIIGERSRVAELSVGEWVMLFYPGQNWFGWYRIHAVGRTNDYSAQGDRFVDVAGPDLPIFNTAPNVFVFGSAVGVYTRMLRVHSDSQWSWD